MALKPGNTFEKVSNFVVARALWRRMLGLFLAILLPLTAFALITLVIFLSTASFG